MNPEQDVLDRIDALVDASLSKDWDEISGYDNDIHQPDCPHEGCSYEWHGLPLGRCPGSVAYGPLKPVRPWNPAALVTKPRVSVVDADGNVTDIPGVISTRIDCDYSSVVGAMEDFRVAAVGLFQVTASTFREIATTLRRGRYANGGVVPDTPQGRALPRPSHQPPMWAARADGRRRRR